MEHSSSHFLPSSTGDPGRDLASVGYRLATLGVLPSSVPVYRVKLAEAGFYSRGQGDEVICYSCRLRHSGWSSGDDPLEIHRRLRPDCQHVVEKDRERESIQRTDSRSGAAATGGGAISRQRETSSSSIRQESSISQQGASASSRHQNEVPRESAGGVRSSGPPPPVSSGQPSGHRHSNSGSQPVQSQPATQPSGSASSTITPSSTSGTGSRTSSTVPEASSAVSNASPPPPPPAQQQQHNRFPQPLLDLARAVHPAYTTLQSRRRTFTSWNESQAPPSYTLALAGFFYQGYLDCVACFYCGVRLKNWRATDDVDREHVRWRPDCQYLRTIRGQDLVNQLRDSLQVEAGESAGNGMPGPSVSAAATAAAVSTSGHSAITAQTSSLPGHTTGQRATVTSSATLVSVTSDPRGPGPSSSVSGQGASPVATARPAQGPGSATEGETDEQRVARLQQQNQRLRDIQQCRACRERQVNTIFMPCGHLVVCDTCAPSVSTCLLCGHTIRATARVYLE